MVKKLQAIADGKDESGPLATAIRESAEKIWLAGLGAFAKARQEPTRAFETLVREGLSLQSRTRALAGERLDEVSDRVNEVKTQISARATDSWDKLEQVFEDRVARSLASLGVPSRKEVQALIDRVDDLTQALEALGGQLPTPRGRRVDGHAAEGHGRRGAKAETVGARRAAAKAAGGPTAMPPRSRAARATATATATATKAPAKKASAAKAGAQSSARKTAAASEPAQPTPMRKPRARKPTANAVA
jgi:poly(hydroxyalkanoate) granule-associated protein